MNDGDHTRDAQEIAFEALLGIANATASALDRVEAAVADERKREDALRYGFGATLSAGLYGLARFGYAVREVGSEWEQIPNVQNASTAKLQASNIFLWTLGERYVLRIKHDPVDGVAEGTQRLFPQAASASRPSTVFLTWDINPEGKITYPRFVCVEEPKWTITLAQLLAHSVTPPVPLPSRAIRGPIVKSKSKPKQDPRRQEGAPQEDG